METKIHNKPAGSKMAWQLLVLCLLFLLPSNLKSRTIHFNQWQTNSSEPQTPGMRTTDFSSPQILFGRSKNNQAKMEFPINASIQLSQG